MFLTCDSTDTKENLPDALFKCTTGVHREMFSAKRTAIIQPTISCNLSCTYCYVLGCRPNGLMDESLVESVMGQVLQANGSELPTEACASL